MLPDYQIKSIRDCAADASGIGWSEEMRGACLLMTNTLSDMLFRWESQENRDIEEFFRVILSKRFPLYGERWLKYATVEQVQEAAVYEYSLLSSAGRGEHLKAVTTRAKSLCTVLKEVCGELLRHQPLLVDASRDKQAQSKRAAFVVHTGRT